MECHWSWGASQMIINPLIRALGFSLATLNMFAFSAHTQAFDLTGTFMDDAAKAYGLDPYLIYAVGLAESARGSNGKVAPHPYTLRSKNGAFYGTKSDAEAELKRILATNDRMVDVGLLQINLHWNGHGVDPLSLLDPRNNAMHGAKILSAAISSAPNDIELGIGRYHAWQDVERSRNYGKRVLAIHKNLLTEIAK